MKIDRKS